MKVKLNNIDYPCFREGEGKPCIVIGLASLTIRCLSNRLKKRFCFYGSDLYWSKDDPSCDYSGKTIESFADDIECCRREWGIDNVLMFSHSATGFIAMEYARKYPQHVFAERYKAEYAAKTAKFWYDFNKDYSYLWQDIELNERLVDYYYGSLLTAYDVRDTYLTIKNKIFIAAGRHDYMVPPFEWVDLDKEMPNMTLHIFEKSGHFPMLEEQALFDELLLKWYKSILQ